jgi:hypothetical protein
MTTKTHPLSLPKAASLTALAAAAAMFPSTARAEEVSPTAKGVVGGAMLGGEVVMLTEAIIGVRDWVPYLIGGGLGAVGGGVGGYFIEKESTDGRAPVYMLAGGLALLIPTVVLTLNATRYRPSEEATEDRAPTNLPPADPGKAGGSSVVGGEAPGGTTTPPAPPSPAPPPSPPPPSGGGGAGGGGTPTSLLNLYLLPTRPNAPSAAPMRVGVPLPQVRPVYTAAERKAMGVEQQTEVRVPVVEVTF